MSEAQPSLRPQTPEAAFAQGANPGFSFRRVYGCLLRHWYLTKGSGIRLLELVYWPTVQMVLWGFLQTFLASEGSVFAMAAGTLVGAVLLWDVLFRGQLGFSLAFFEEIWSRNLGHLLVSPLRPGELVLGLMCISTLKSLLSLIPTSFLAMWFFGFNVYELGLALVAFYLNLLLFGWALGLIVSGLVVRFGQGAESLAWALTFAIAPLCGIYYPISVLPDWLAVISSALAPSYVFEGMRMILLEQQIDLSLLWKAFALNAAGLAVGFLIFKAFLADARERATLLQLGE